MADTILNRYKDKWVLSSAAKAVGGLTIDVEPVRVISSHETRQLAGVLREVLGEHRQVVPDPDLNDPRCRVGMRARAVGATTWRAFVKHARAFRVEQSAAGLVLEEWPRVGGSFNANPVWRQEFPRGAFEQVAEYLVEVTG